MKKLFILLFIITPLLAGADNINRGFSVIDQHLEFDKTIRSGICHGTMPYPKLVGEDDELFMKINDEIHDFVELHGFCNNDDRNNFLVSYDIPDSGTKDFFSILWLTKKDNELWRIDVLNFNTTTGDILKIADIFNNDKSNSILLKELIKLSQGRLNLDCTWEQFIEKIEKKDIQFYIDGAEWHICFNSYGSFNKVIQAQMPQYFLL